MQKKGRIFFTLAVFVLVILFLSSSTNIFLKEREKEIYNISVVVTDTNDDCWKNFKKGMEQSANKCKANVSFITMYERGIASQQEELIRREIENGTQALIISPVNSESVSDILNEKGMNIPTIALGDDIESSSKKAYIGTDWTETGRLLAKAVLKDNTNDAVREIVTLSLANSGKDIDAISLGIEETVAKEEMNIPIDKKVFETKEEMDKYVQMLKYKGKGTAVIALETWILQEISIDFEKNNDNHVRFYGVGYTNKILRHIEDGDINAVVVTSDFDKGYLSVEMAVGILKNKGYLQKVVQTQYTVRSSNIHDSKLELMLYPL